MRIIQVLERKEAGLRVLNLGMDTSTPTGKLMLTVLGGIAQFEREMMLERQREGVAKAKAAGCNQAGGSPSCRREDDEDCYCWSTKHQEATVYRILAAASKQKILS